MDKYILLYLYMEYSYENEQTTAIILSERR